jgi:hypothetical protein
MDSPKAIVAAAILLVCAAAGGLAQASLGAVTVRYTLHRIPRRASNQLAVWIEDAKGTYVRTLFATDFMARRGGFRLRPQCCPEWVAAAGLERLSPAEVDAVSGATQAPGVITLSWDCRTSAGDPVPAGTYFYKVEGNIYYERRVLWTGGIRVGSAASRSTAAPQYLPDASAAGEGALIEGVSASFRPAGG